MSDETSGQLMPVDLHFIDRRALEVDVDAIIRLGLKKRRNRKAIGAAVSAVVIGVAGLSAAHLVSTAAVHTQAASETPLSVFEQSSIVKNHPPAGGQITVLATRPGPHGSSVSAVAWISGGETCFGAGDLASGSGTTVYCTGTQTGLERLGTPGVLAPVFSPVADTSGNQPAIGFTRGDASRITLIFRGRDYQATVVPLPGAASAGTYVVWLPSEGKPSTVATVTVDSKDISSVTAYNQAGSAIASTR